MVVSREFERYYSIMVKNELLEQILALKPADRETIFNAVEASFSKDLPPQLSAADRRRLLKQIEESKKHPERLLSWRQVKVMLAKQRADRVR